LTFYFFLSLRACL